MTYSEEEKRFEIGIKYIQLLNESGFKTSEAFDRAILTLSSAALSLSLLFIDNVVPFDKAYLLVLLYSSWIGFLCAITSNIINLFIASAEITELKRLVDLHYFKKNTNSGSSLASFKSKTLHLDVVSGVFYIVAMVLMVIFMTININR